MINRGLKKNSSYIFNAETGMLEKNEDNDSTIESLSKQLESQIKNLDELAENINKNQKQEPVNNIVVITADDNLIHNYFYDLDVSWDASNCLSSAIIKMPKMNTENTNYWATYTGQLTIYAGYNFTFDVVNNNNFTNEQDAANSITKYWDNSNIKPFFRGEISRVKEYENDIKIYVDSIGRRFQQKIPDEFRQAFINNQNVRDAFQAICEFLGVKHICPPKTVTDNGEEEVEEEGTEEGKADANDKLNTEKDIAKKVKKKVKNSTTKKSSKKKKSTSKSTKKTNSTSNATNSSMPNQNGENGENGENSEENPEDALTNNEEIEKPQDGYAEVNFDSNGAIVYGSKIIETSPDMAETLLAMEENPLEKYLEDETGIVESVNKLLDGDMFDEIHNRVMDYDAITIEPKASSSSDASATGATTPTDAAANAANANNTNNSGSSGGSSGGSSQPVRIQSAITSAFGHSRNLL